MIQNGIIQTDNINGIPVFIDLIPTSNKTSRPQKPMSPTSITVHNTGNSKKGADAEMHTEYVDETEFYVSWHFTVDDVAIYQELPINEISYHAGDGGNGKGNTTSISIEICEHVGINWDKAKRNAINLINFLTKNVSTIKHIVPHKNWKSRRYPNGKYCPHRILDEGWDKFIQDIKDAKKQPPTQSNHWAESDFQYLNNNGIPVHDRRYSDNITRAEVISLQARQLRKNQSTIAELEERISKLESIIEALG